MSNFYLCSVPRCGNTIPKPGRCLEHKRITQAFNKMLRPRNPLYGTTRWQVLRLHILQANPLCVSCGQVATQVDHIKPYEAEGEGGSFWDPTNLQSLCQSCHSRKTARGDGGFGNRKRRAD